MGTRGTRFSQFFLGKGVPHYFVLIEIGERYYSIFTLLPSLQRIKNCFGVDALHKLTFDFLLTKRRFYVGTGMPINMYSVFQFITNCSCTLQ